MNSSSDPAAADVVKARKQEHLQYAVSAEEAGRPAGWHDVELTPRALPEVDFEEIDLSTEFFDQRLGAPLLIAGMTGGHADAEELNAILAESAERHGLAIGVGSQRAALHDPSVAYTYEIVRELAPTALVIGNLGAAQLIGQGEKEPLTAADAREAVRMVGADALAIHLNFLEEVVQPEGDRRASGCLAAIRALTQELGDETPVIAKETGAGVSGEVAALLARAGVAALDVGGRGGTSFAAIEGMRAAAHGDKLRAKLGATFHDWGLPTVVSLTVTRDCGLPVIATGGVRTGLDIAKGLALGATLVGVARPLLLAAREDGEAVERMVRQLLTELRVAMYLTGCRSVEELRAVPRAILGETGMWLQQLM